MWQTSQMPLPGSVRLAKLPSARPARLSNRMGTMGPCTVSRAARTSDAFGVPCGSWHCAHGNAVPFGAWVAVVSWQSPHGVMAR